MIARIWHGTTKVEDYLLEFEEKVKHFEVFADEA